jgi:Zn-dependent peptidase ImmA (M78 family)/DNA-binding XRE family transcriptional regulator
MPSKTPGFVGVRLREAREVRNLRAVELSEMLGVSPQAVSSYETGKKSPSPAIAESLVRILNLPPAFFTSPDERGELDEPPFFRSMSGATKQARTRAARRERWLEQITDYLSDTVSFPEVNFPDLSPPADPLMLTDDDIEHYAEDTRKYWGMSEGPISNVVYLLENQGAVVARDSFGAATLDSLTVVSPSSRPFVMIGTDKGTPVRWRFDAAHELGHVMLHSHLDRRRLTKPADFKQIEQQAHLFAGAFLLPAAPFADDFFAASLDTLQEMKPRWKVSIGAMMMRARQLNLMSEQTARRMWINYSRRGWRRSEPLDDVMPVESPRLLHKAIDLFLGDGVHNADDLRAGVRISDRDIEALCSLPEGYLSGVTHAPVALREELAEGARVLRFPSRPRALRGQA